MIPINDERTQFYGVDKANNYLYLITVNIGGESVFDIAHVAIIPPNGSHSTLVSSLAINKKTLFVGGGYNITTPGHSASTPFILAYNISDVMNPVLDTTYFEDGKWAIGGVFTSVYIQSSIFFSKSKPYSFLFGYASSIFHVASPKGFYSSLNDTKNSHAMPFVS